VSADGHLNAAQFMYHISDAANHESIASKGLRGSRAHSDRPRVYLTTDPAHYAGFASEEDPPLDVWRVHTKGLSVRPDPNPGDAMHGAHYYEGNIGPRRVHHVGDAFEYALEHGGFDE